ncbi:MAG: DUF3467 domain-containing protein [Ilumatobacter fluminis]|uniref:DUF3467 domain-containing protein n=1 Tax=Ilumatobacter fluminis TaxID=467091 RepID=UPI0032EBD3EB
MKIHSTPDQMGGVWANGAAVRHSPHEFTIDFMRFDYDNDGKPQAGVLVQRVNMSPLFVSQLITALQDNWSKYASKAMPQELIGDAVIDPDTIRHQHEDDGDDADDSDVGDGES